MAALAVTVINAPFLIPPIGVCGIPRFSIRSIIATASFMLTGFATASIKQFGKVLLGYFYQADTDEDINADREYIAENYRGISTAVLSASLTVIVMCFIFQHLSRKEGAISDTAVAVLTGAIFGLGLVISGMNRRSKILGFLTINRHWDRKNLDIYITY